MSQQESTSGIVKGRITHILPRNKVFTLGKCRQFPLSFTSSNPLIMTTPGRTCLATCPVVEGVASGSEGGPQRWNWWTSDETLLTSRLTWIPLQVQSSFSETCVLSMTLKVQSSFTDSLKVQRVHCEIKPSLYLGMATGMAIICYNMGGETWVSEWVSG
jgi:hypothetical protein